MPKISIIVPVYCVEQYLDKCVQSILNQTFTDFELILVDDGSPDKCGEMCDQYAEKDSRVVVIHKENGGLSDARNAGIDAASAEYIGFVDSDDYIAEDMYEMLYDNIIKYDADISTCGLYDCYAHDIRQTAMKKETFCVNTEAAIKLVLESKKITISSVNKLYRKKLFESVRFPVGRLYEDAFTTIKIFIYAQKIVVSTIPKYYYYHHENTITTGNYQHKHDDMICAYQENLALIEKNYPKLKSQAMFRYVWAHCVILDKMIVQKHYKDISNYEDILLFIKRHVLFILFNPNFTMKRKLSSLLLCLSPSCYRNLIIKQNKFE